MEKTYRNLVCQNYGITLTINGVSSHINFSGGKRHPVISYGKYTTADLETQKALESHHLFGKEWVLEGGFVSTTVSEPEPEPEISQESRIIRDTVTTGNATIVLEPKNVQQMKEWLNKNMNVPYSKMKLRDDVFNAANDLNIEFKNVQK
jgi:hypothetical protein